MIKTHAKYLAVLVTVIGLLLNFTTPILAQNFPHWGNHEPSGTGNTPPNGQEFVRQDPLPKSLEDVNVLSSTGKHVSLQVEFDDAYDYEIAYGPDGKKYRRYKADSRYRITAKPGEPEILRRLVWLQVPYDAKNIQIAGVKQFSKEDSQMEVNIYPRPNVIIEENKEKGTSNEYEQFYIDEDYYKKDFWGDTGNIIIEQEGCKHGMHQIQIAIPVMRYNPKRQYIEEFKSTSLTVMYESDSRDNVIRVDARHDPFHKVFNDTVANYAYDAIAPREIDANFVELPLEALGDRAWASEHNFYPDYLVIAAKEYRESEALIKWALHRSSHGEQHSVAIAYVDDIYQVYTAQDQPEENIKDFVQMAYDWWRYESSPPNLSYLLLIGDADYSHDLKEWFLPLWRTQDPESLAGYAGDNDYAWLENDGEEDYMNDVLLGRLPAQSETELSIMVNKIIHFERNPPQTENSYGSRILRLAGKSLDSPNLIRDLIINPSENHAGPYELEEYDCDYEGGIEAFSYDSDKITNFLNNDGALFVSYLGHGDPSLAFSNWTGWHPGVVVDNLDNGDKLPLIVMSHACSTARFDYSHPDYNFMPFSSYGENWIKKAGGGSICFWGVTRLGRLQNIPMDEQFYLEIIENKQRHIGVITEYLRTHFDTSSFWGYNVPFHQHHIVSFLGDPAITFENHFQPTTKPDFKIRYTTVFGNPTHVNEIQNIQASIVNNSLWPYSDVPYRLYSINQGDFEDLFGECSVTFPTGSAAITVDHSKPYQAESSRNFMCWVDPNNVYEERSEFNNHIQARRKYYPIYVDKNHVGLEHGTQESPYRSLAPAVAHAKEHDYIGEKARKNDAAIQIKVKEGAYGSGQRIESDISLEILGMSKPENTIIRDGLDLSGNLIVLRDLYFDGSELNDEIVNVKVSEYNAENHCRMYRTSFTDSEDYAIHTSRTVVLENCIFFDNYGLMHIHDTNNNQRNKAPMINIFNVTAFQNERNLFFDQSEYSRYLHISDSILWNTGISILPDDFTPDNVRIKPHHSDIDDEVLLENIHPNFEPEGNIEADPLFMNPFSYDLHLNPNSPCIDTASAGGTDPDGTPPDMGAYGGPDAIIRPIRILEPVHGNTIYKATEPPFSHDLRIKWSAYQLYPNALVNIKIHHMKYEIAYPDKGNNTPHYNGVRIIDLDVLVENSQTYLATIEQEIPTQSYWLTITNNENSEEYEKINFKITSESSSIKSNR